MIKVNIPDILRFYKGPGTPPSLYMVREMLRKALGKTRGVTETGCGFGIECVDISIRYRGKGYWIEIREMHED